jgi:hypothetical protein
MAFGLKAFLRKGVARTTAFVVRVFSAPGWSDQIRWRGSEGALTRSIPQSETGDQTVRRSPSPAIRHQPDLLTDGLRDSSALCIGRRRLGKERYVWATHG